MRIFITIETNACDIISERTVQAIETQKLYCVLGKVKDSNKLIIFGEC